MALQYIRAFKLTVEGGGQPLDFSNFRVVFSIEQTTTQRPNTLECFVYNVAKQTAQRFIEKKYQTVTITAGYRENYGIIFKGQIKFARYGQENPVDKRLDLFCGDGSSPYENAVTNKSLAPGWTHKQVVDAAFEPMKKLGATMGTVMGLPDTKHAGPRVMLGMSRDILRVVGKATGTQWSLQNGALTIVPKNAGLPGGEIEYNSRTGLIGLPTQTPGGIYVRTLLDPRVRPHQIIRLNNASIQRATPDLSVQGPVKDARLPSIDADGKYKVIVLSRTGDTMGGEGGPWFNDLVCLSADGRGFVPENLLQYVPH